METLLKNCGENCKEKIAEISAKSLEIDKLKNALDVAGREIEERITEIKKQASQLTGCQEDLKRTNADLEERRRQIEVRRNRFIYTTTTERLEDSNPVKVK